MNHPMLKCVSECPDQSVHPQSDQGLQCQITESLDTTECMNGEQRPGWYFTHVQDDLNLCILYMLEGTSSLGAAQIIVHLFL